MPSDQLQVLAFESAQAWEDWLAEHHDGAAGLWLKIAKKGSGIPSVSYSEAVDVALCHGWIDGQKGSLDDQHWLQRFTPRKPGSKWSRINTQRAAALIEAGRMRPAGLREVERAKADGRWEAAYHSQATATVPADFAAALAEDERASAFFATLNSANRYAILYRIAEAKRPETRAKRIAGFVAMLREHKQLHP
ncbi:MAG TPA: YdeI/OmpD-associated family protein [Streptosporangiaceae bacterium]|jgi:uncharacterized protein YdeI (YjbR/CyaY-like superfamily)